jgi:DNA processing protein
MIINTLTLSSDDYPSVLQQMVKPPQQLYHAGAPLSELLQRPSVAMVGSRNISPYGKQITEQLAHQLAKQGIVIISGLAMGVDAVAHRAALDAGGLTIAVLPSPLDAVAPTTNRQLAQQIVEQGGALVSEYESGTHPVKQFFIARNRIVAGLADAVLITEAAEKSGSLHTARFALEQGKDVLAVPGNISNVGSVGTNNIIKSGAGLVTTYTDVLHALGLEDHQTAAHDVRGRNAHEQLVLDLLLQGTHDGDQLLERSGLVTAEFNQVITMLEIGGKIRSLGANQWAIY